MWESPAAVGNEVEFKRTGHVVGVGLVLTIQSKCTGANLWWRGRARGRVL